MNPAERAPAGPVPFASPARALESVRAEALGAFDRLAAEGRFVLGSELAGFEAEFAEFCGRSSCVGTASGTDALRLALSALDLDPGARVVTAAQTFVATAEAIAGAGARPVLVDIHPDTRCMDPAALAAAGPDAAVALPVHLFGHPADMEAIAATCASTGMRLVEDAAQAHGALAAGRRAGSWGDAAAFSFYPTKNLPAMGDGGAVVCHDPVLAERLRSLRHHGFDPAEPGRHARVGEASRLDEMQAAVLRLGLRRLEGWNDERRRIADLYRELLSDLPLQLPPPDPAGGAAVYHLFVVELDQRDRVRADLAAAGIQTGVHYPLPVHLQPAWRHLGYAPGDFPHAEALARRALSLPLFPGLTEAEVDRVAAGLRGALGG